MGDAKFRGPRVRAVYVIGCLTTYFVAMAFYAIGLGWLRDSFGILAIAGLDALLIGVALLLIYKDRQRLNR